MSLHCFIDFSRIPTSCVFHRNCLIISKLTIHTWMIKYYFYVDEIMQILKNQLFLWSLEWQQFLNATYTCARTNSFRYPPPTHNKVQQDALTWTDRLTRRVGSLTLTPRDISQLRSIATMPSPPLSLPFYQNLHRWMPQMDGRMVVNANTSITRTFPPPLPPFLVIYSWPSKKPWITKARKRPACISNASSDLPRLCSSQDALRMQTLARALRSEIKARNTETRRGEANALWRGAMRCNAKAGRRKEIMQMR